MFTTEVPLARSFVEEDARIRQTMTVPATTNLRQTSSVKYHDQPFRLVLNGLSATENYVNVDLPWLNLARDSFMVGVHSIKLTPATAPSEESSFFLDNRVQLSDICEGDITSSGKILGEASIFFADQPIKITEGPDREVHRGDIGSLTVQTTKNRINPVVRESQGNFNFRWRLTSSRQETTAGLERPVREIEMILQFYPSPYWRQRY